MEHVSSETFLLVGKDDKEERMAKEVKQRGGKSGLRRARVERGSK